MPASPAETEGVVREEAILRVRKMLTPIVDRFSMIEDDRAVLEHVLDLDPRPVGDQSVRPR